MLVDHLEVTIMSFDCEVKRFKGTTPDWDAEFIEVVGFLKILVGKSKRIPMHPRMLGLDSKCTSYKGSKF